MEKECYTIRMVSGRNYPQLLIQKQLSYLGIRPNDVVEIYVSDGKVIIRKVNSND